MYLKTFEKGTERYTPHSWDRDGTQNWNVMGTETSCVVLAFFHKLQGDLKQIGKIGTIATFGIGY
jgi:hypothetical protein